MNDLSGVMKFLTIEPNVQDSVTGRELFHPRPRIALWKRQSHQLAVSLNQRLSLPCPWAWRLSRLHPSAARAWQVHISTVSCLRSGWCPRVLTDCPHAVLDHAPFTGSYKSGMQ